MPSIGERLREARMRQRIDITEVERATKIRAKYLRALENEEYDLLPGPTFVRSFLKTYADYLGLDARLLTEEFRERYEPPREDETPAFSPPSATRRGRAAPERGPPGRGIVIAGVLVAILGLLLVLGLTGEGPPEPGDQSAEQTAAEERSAGEQQRAERRESQRRKRPTRVRLRVSPGGEPTYACIDRGGDPPVFEGTLTSARTFSGKRLRINLGRPSTQLTVNGDRVPIREGANPVGFAFAPGRKPRALPVGRRPCA